MASLNLTPYYKSISRRNREKVIVEYMGLVRCIASTVNIPRRHSVLSKQDLIAAGMCGLIQAVDSFKDTGVSLKQYASSRIMGAIKDEFRDFDVLSRTGREYKTKINAVRKEYRIKHGKEIDIGTLSRKTKIKKSHLRTVMRDLMYSAVEPNRNPLRMTTQTPEGIVNYKMVVDIVRNAIDKLSIKDKKILQDIYIKDMPVSKVAASLKISVMQLFYLKRLAIGRVAPLIKKKLTETTTFSFDLTNSGSFDTSEFTDEHATKEMYEYLRTQ